MFFNKEGLPSQWCLPVVDIIFNLIKIQISTKAVLCTYICRDLYFKQIVLFCIYHSHCHESGILHIRLYICRFDSWDSHYTAMNIVTIKDAYNSYFMFTNPWNKYSRLIFSARGKNLGFWSSRVMII